MQLTTFMYVYTYVTNLIVMKRKIFALVPMFVLLAGALVIGSCEKDDDDNEGGEGSHNAGMDCLACHKSGGEGEGTFRVGGTVYNASNAGLDGAVVKLYATADRTGTAVATLTSDGSGNFYTKSSVSFGTGLYATITSGTSTASMVMPITSGACSSCHGSATPKITVN